MMPARPESPGGRQPDNSQRTIPLSSLFTNSFDRATLEATLPFADKSIFVAPNGRRYRFESLPDGADSPATTTTTTTTLTNTTPSGLARLPFSSRLPPHSRDTVGIVGGRAVPDDAFAPKSSLPSGADPRIPSQLTSDPRPLARGEPAARRRPSGEMAETITQTPVTGFGAAAFFSASDGGVLAAETLTDGHLSLDLPIPESPPPSPGSASRRSTVDIAPDQTLPTTASYDLLYARVSQQPARTSSMPPRQSLLEGSIPITGRIVRPGPSPRHNSEPQTASSLASSAYQYGTRDDRTGGSAIAYEMPYDTQTPIVVYPSPQPSSTSSRSDRVSAGRDNVLPGEDMLYDGQVQLAQNLTSPFVGGSLRVFRNALTSDLRFYCRVGNDSETYWLKGAHGKVIPVYAYNHQLPNIMYVRDNDSDRANNYVPGPSGDGRPSKFYQFPRLQDLCDFQAKLTGQRVVLDISAARLLRLRKAHSRSTENISSVRVQVWHEEEVRRSSQTDVASFSTAGTTLSGPLRHRLVPRTSKLMIFLGRLEEYVTVFITDDIELVPEGQTTVKLKPRRGSILPRRGSRWPGVKAHRELSNGEPAGLDVRGQGTDPDSVESFPVYDKFEIEFESSPSQDNFVRKWNEVIQERRSQRRALAQIREETGHKTFTASTARELW